MDLTELKSVLSEMISGAPGFAQVDLLEAFPVGRALPLPGAAMLISIDSLELTPAAIAGFAGEVAGAAITMRFDLFAPEQCGADLHGLYACLCALLMSRGTDFGVERVWSERLTWDDAAGSYRLSARALMRGRASCAPPSEPAQEISDFRLRARLQ